MNLPEIDTVETAGEAQGLAIDWQHWQTDQDMSWGEVAAYADYFRTLGEKFNLTEEFIENGII